LMAPMTPHIAHEIWEMEGYGDMLATEPWPTWEEELAREETVTLVVQVNGKVRGKLEVAVDAGEDAVVELARGNENVEKFLVDKTIRKVIYVPNKILNFVVG